jgi:UDP-N-acetylglucosamine--N-acetylmuramyl-(pentapeptide) pyrophosphoryl-undecaprenol N-acetylglucosamine transferase
VSSEKLAVVAAGGTGGHLFPAEAVALELQKRGWRVVLATDLRGAQFADHFPAEERLALDAATFKSSDPIGVVRGLMSIGAGTNQARKAFQRLRPKVVVGFGGYPSLPALLAAKTAGVPTVVHEQNSVLGRVNRRLAPSAACVACAFPTLEKASPKVKARVKVVGNPVRKEIRAIYDRLYPRPGSGPIRLLVTGGSQGARLLSEATPAAVAQLPENLRYRLHVTQQTRPESMADARRIYGDSLVDCELAPFFRDMAGRLARSHLVIGRAGASTVSELAVAGRPSILVPLAIATDDHQRLNAKFLADVGAAEVIPEKQLMPERLAAAILSFADDHDRLSGAAEAAKSVALPDAAETLADLIEGVAA